MKIPLLLIVFFYSFANSKRCVEPLTCVVNTCEETPNSLKCYFENTCRDECSERCLKLYHKGMTLLCTPILNEPLDCEEQKLFYSDHCPQESKVVSCSIDDTSPVKCLCSEVELKAEQEECVSNKLVNQLDLNNLNKRCGKDTEGTYLWENKYEEQLSCGLCDGADIDDFTGNNCINPRPLPTLRCDPNVFEYKNICDNVIVSCANDAEKCLCSKYELNETKQECVNNQLKEHGYDLSKNIKNMWS